MTNVVQFEHPADVAVSRNRAKAIAVIAPRLLEMAMAAQIRSINIDGWRRGLPDVVFSWDRHPDIPGGVYVRVEETAVSGGRLLMTGWIVFGGKDAFHPMSANLADTFTFKTRGGDQVTIRLSHWRRGGWERVLFETPDKALIVSMH